MEPKWATLLSIDHSKAEIILEKLKWPTSQSEWLLGTIASVRVMLMLSDYYRLRSRIIYFLSDNKAMKNSGGFYTGKKLVSLMINRRKTAAGFLSLNKENAKGSCKLIQKTTSPHFSPVISNANPTYLVISYSSSSPLNFPYLLDSAC